MKRLIVLFWSMIAPVLSLASEWQPEDFKQPHLCRAAQELSSYNSGDLKAMRMLVDGEDRWLFRSNLDLKNDFDISAEMLSELTRLGKAYQDNGIQLAMIRIPTRGLVYSNKLTPFSSRLSGFQFKKAADSFRQSNNAIRQGGILVPDLSNLFSWSDNRLQIFFKRDNHWTPEGAQYISSLVAQQLSSLSMVPGSKNFETRYAGLLKKKRTPFEKAAFKICGLNYPEEYAKALTTTAELSDTEDSLFSDEQTPSVFLLGTSFSNGFDNYNFAGSLQEHIHSDIFNLSVAGGNLDAAMDQYLHGFYKDNIKPRLMLWEVPGYLSFQEPVFYRRMIPALYNSCSGSSVRLKKQVALHDGSNQVLLNKNPSHQFMKSHEHLIGLKFSNVAIRDFYIKVWYASGDSEKVRIQRSRRIENRGVYYLELNAMPRFKKQNFIAAEVIVDYPESHPGSVEAQLCRRTDLVNG